MRYDGLVQAITPYDQLDRAHGQGQPQADGGLHVLPAKQFRTLLVAKVVVREGGAGQEFSGLIYCPSWIRGSE